MLEAPCFGEQLRQHGYDFFSGVPCSFLKGFLNYTMDHFTYIAAADEGSAVAVCAGAFLGGKKPVVIMQNSGLANAVSPLTSLIYTFRIPVLGFVSVRGDTGMTDEPQHELMGRITSDLLDLMGIQWEYLGDDLEKTEGQLTRADQTLDAGLPYFFLVRKDIFRDEGSIPVVQMNAGRNRLCVIQNQKNQLPTRYEALSVINALKDRQTLQLGTTGKTGRELYEIEDCENNLYLVGSMGCIGSLGLGLALAKPDKDVVVLDGDGSLLMKMGCMAVNGFYNPDNLLHILLDNFSYESTGGQFTVSSSTDFVRIAASCGYVNALHIHNLDELCAAIQNWKRKKNLTFLRLPIMPGSSTDLGRPQISPMAVKERMVRFIHG